MGSSEMSQIHVLWSHFWRQLVTVDFDDVSLQKYVPGVNKKPFNCPFQDRQFQNQDRLTDSFRNFYL